MSTTTEHPFPDFLFQVEIDNVAGIDFAEVSGLTLETDVVEYRTGSAGRTIKMPGRSHTGDVTFKRGMTQSSVQLWEWYQTVLSGNVDRRTVQLTSLNLAREPQIRWTFREAWPRKYVGPMFDARGGNGVAIEQLVLVYEDVRINQ
ncbi:phage tail protein [Jannaschia sp. CCS1]|uniref:phage tail protein n=1 Tax=Jannaschia sp. (strain CCS1) TaxID=290400 RepID=UPI000053B995|nr:phage tail protein [Jannaschia sp. CCS1]ABD55107.1 hypothetical protein Jann_2190 [Jannaschia sp. CCS1]